MHKKEMQVPFKMVLFYNILPQNFHHKDPLDPSHRISTGVFVPHVGAWAGNGRQDRPESW